MSSARLRDLYAEAERALVPKASVVRPKMLSLRQPWAWCVILGGKDRENRQRAPGFAGPMLIQVARTFDRTKATNWRAYVELELAELNRRGMLRRVPTIEELAMQLGMVIGSVEVCGWQDNPRTEGWAIKGLKGWRLEGARTCTPWEQGGQQMIVDAPLWMIREQLDAKSMVAALHRAGVRGFGEMVLTFEGERVRSGELVARCAETFDEQVKMPDGELVRSGDLVAARVRRETAKIVEMEAST